MPAKHLILASLALALAAGEHPAGAAKKPAPKKPAARRRTAPPRARPGRGPGFFVTAEGLGADSSRVLALYQGSRCIKVGRVGRPNPVPPGEYDVRVGFPSGWVSRKLAIQAGQQLVVPTGLFRFRDLTPGAFRSTVPQKLYHEGTYLATGYQGQTARLYPGTYTVIYHLPSDDRPARAVDSWWQIGPFPVRWKNRMPVDTVWPVEKTPMPDVTKGCTVNKRTYTWQRIRGRSELYLSPAPVSVGAYYLAVEVNAPQGGLAELALTCRGLYKLWLNGRLVKSMGFNRRTAYRIARHTALATLRKGRNVVLVKAFSTKSMSWPVRVGMETWRSYEVAVRDGGRVPAAAAGPVGAKAPVRPKLPPPLPGIRGLVLVQVPNLRDGRSGLNGEQFRIVRRPYKSRLCTLIPAAPNGKLTDLTGKQFAAVINPDLSYDGRRVVFSARRTNRRGEYWNVYEMNVDGTGLRQITRGLRDCFDPYYLPNGRILFSSTKDNFRDEYDRDYPPLLHACDADGSNVEKLSFNLSSDTHAIVLNDGRVLFNSWQHHGDHEREAGNFSLCTILPDGTGLNLFTGNELRRDRMSRTMGYPQQLADGRVVFVETAGHRMYNTGSLTAVHLRKPLSSRQILTPGIDLNSGYNLAGRYASPYPLPDGRMLVAYSPGRCTAALRTDPAEDPRLGIYVFDFAAGRPGQLVFDDPACQDYDALAICERPVPPIVPRMAVAGRKTGVMFCVNAYVSDRPRQEKQVVVGQLPPAEPGQIKGVRVLEGFGVEDKDPRYHKPIVIDMLQMTFGAGSNSGNNFEQKRIVGYAPCEPDGSFNVEVPADTTLCLQTLDARGMALETQLTWTWVRPGETRMCVGCHEDREMALPNLDCLAMRRPAHLVARPPEKRHTVDFRRDVMPVIEKRCSRCHDGRKPKPAGGLDLRAGFELVFHRGGRTGRRINGAFFNHAYESLLQAPSNRVGTLVISGAAKYSPLIWRLYGEKLAFTDTRNPYKKPCKRMPPDRPLPDAEKRLFVEWIDLGAQWDNLPGEDDLPGYDAVQSRKLAAEADRLVRRPIADARKAFQIRCLDCHDSRRLAPMRTLPHSKVPAMIKRMAAKRKGWIHNSEIPLITKYIYQTYPKGKGK